MFVEIEHRIPRRFTHIILYEYTTIDPLQVLISQEITSITDVMRKGSGNILANIRQCHMEAEMLIGEVMDDLAGSNFSGILDVGLPNTPALGVTVDPSTWESWRWEEQIPWLQSRKGESGFIHRLIKGLMDVKTMSEILDY